VLVDTGVGGQAERILGALAQKGRTPEDVSLILITHGHGDHTGSAEALQIATGAPIALGKEDAEKALAGADLEMHGRGLVGRTMLKMIRSRHDKTPPHPGPVADINLEGEMSLAEYGVDARVFPLPGHTRGSFAVMTGEGDALVGDILGGGGRSRKKPEVGVFANDDEQMDDSIRALVAMKPRLAYTGHDQAPFTLEQLEEAFG
jgi:hydroxyacylglutathione hydrolase